MDVAPTGEVRIVDYKTGKAPRPEYAEGALFQMKFYALVLWRLRGRGAAAAAAGLSGQRGRADATTRTRRICERVERKLLALWEAIQRGDGDG